MKNHPCLVVSSSLVPSSPSRSRRRAGILSGAWHRVALAFAVFVLLIFTQETQAGAWYVGNTQNGEWVQYNKVWFAAGTYRFTARVGSPSAGAKIHMEIDGTPLISSVNVPNTGRADKFSYVHLGTRTLTQGVHDLRVIFETSGMSLDWFMAVKDTDTTTSVKASDKVMVPPPSNGMIIAPVTAFHPSESNGTSSSLLHLGYPIKDANGNSFTDAQAQAWWSVPMTRDHDCRTDRYWDILVDQFTATRANSPYFYCKSTSDFTNSLQDREYRGAGGGYEGRWLQKWTEAVGRNPQAAQSVRIGMIWDQGGLGHDFYTIHGYYPKWSTPALVDFAFKYYLSPWLDNVPAWMLFRPQTGRILIRMMSISPGGLVNDGNLGVFLQEVRNRMQLLYGVDPLFIVPHDGPNLNSAALAQIWGRVRGLEWDGPLLTQNTYNGTMWCGTSVGSRHGLDQVWLNDWNPITDTGTPGGNSAGHDSHQPRLDGSGNSNFLTTLATAQSLNAKVVEEEGFTNLEEGNSIFRSRHPEWQFPNQHMAAMRQFADPASQTLMFEAEACDIYNKISPVGNKGGTYRREWYSASNLDVYRPIHNVSAWTTKDGGPGNLVQIAAGFFDVWAVDSAGAVWARRITGSPDVWTKVAPAPPQPLSMVSIGKGWAWGLSTSGAVYYCHLESGAAHYINQGWSTASGGAMAHIDVGETEVWATNASGNVYRRPIDGGTGSWTLVTGTMQKIWVGDAFVWGINGGQLYYSLIATPPASTPISWVSVVNPNNLVQLDCGSDEVWGVNAAGNVYRKSASNVGAWEAVSGATASTISVGENYAWGLSGSNAVTCKLEGFLLSEVPPAPLAMGAKTAPGQTTLSWIPTDGATSYTIKRATSSGGPYTTVGTTSGTSFTNTGLTNGTTYYYVIEAATALGNTGNSTQLTVQPAAAPAAPSGLSATSVSIGQVNLAWTDNASNEAGFLIERRPAGSPAVWEPVKRIYSANVTSYSDTSAASGTNYTYRVRAYNSNLTESGNSNEAQATTHGGTTIHVNFQPLDQPTPPGYLVDNGQTYGPSDRNNQTYGWTVDSKNQTRVRGLNGNLLLDSVLLWLANAKWEIAVPNGTYTVTVGIGDGVDTVSSTVNVEGVNYWNNVNLGPGQFVNATNSVTVTDGKLTLDQGTKGNDATRIDYVQITPTSASQSAPTSLAAVAGNGQVALSWAARSGATGYTVLRSTNPNYIGYTAVGTPTGTTFTDTTPNNGTVYYYSVSAKLSGSAETDKATPVGVLPGALASPWVSQSIGGSPGDGAHVEPNTSTPVAYSILAKGTDIWDSSDQFRYVYQSSTGDCSIVAQVTSVQAVDQWTKVGVMIRETLAAGAKNAALVVTPGNGVSFQWRSSTSGGSSNSTTSGLGAPRWVKVTRVGNVFTAYQSADGATWVQVGSPQTITMGASAYIGLVVTSHEQNTWALGSLSIVSAVPYTSGIPLGSTINLKAQVNNQWVCAEGGGNDPLIANRATPGGWEAFTVVDMSASYGPNAMALVADNNGKYVCADSGGSSPLIANRTSPGSWETFYWTNNGDGTISLKANANNNWVSAAGSGSSPLISSASTVGAAEKFIIQIVP